MSDYIIKLDQLTMQDLDQVGGKNASLGEMITHLNALGVKVPGGFATTAYAFKEFLQTSGLNERISKELKNLDTDNIDDLRSSGEKIRNWVLETPFQAPLEAAVRTAYDEMKGDLGDDFTVAVRSSATAEDLPDASFAGQQETFLNVHGADEILSKAHEVFASLYNDRAISYRVHHGFEHDDVYLSAGIQQMVRSDIAASGVMFTMDTESGFNDVVFITSSYGLGEMVVQGAVNPDEFYVYKPALKADRPAVLRRNLGSKAIEMTYGESGVQTQNIESDRSTRFSINDDEVQQLAKQAMIIEQHYGRPMDIEWAKDGLTGELYIVQARPETVKSRENQGQKIERYALKNKGAVVCEGRSIGQKVGQGTAKVIKSIAQMDQINSGDVLVTDMTDPDWEPIMKKAAAIVTNRGGRTCHAAIIARELGIPAIVGCGDATSTISHDQEVTVSCCEGDTGYVYDGKLGFDIHTTDLENMPEAPLKIMMNVGNPDRAFDFQNLPHFGIGLARLEFIINRMIGIHPKVLLNYDQQPEAVTAITDPMIAAYASPREYFVKRLAEGISTLAAAFSPEPVIVRLSDFKSNEYANLIGGKQYEPHEENPMLGFRGASRYLDDSFVDCFEMECEALKYIRDEMGLTNVWAMVPFVRTLAEGQGVIDLMAKNGLKQGENDLKIIMMCELPSNALMADEFLDIFDGFSIGSNDMTQLTLGLDRDSGIIADLFDERDPAVKKMLAMAITACKKRGKYIGICGQGPSDHPDLAQWLMEHGIESVSLNPDTVVETWLKLAK
ncbi:phosphoenolpyruvate synthase [Marinicella sp. S1101]|uniref:phosphoenolpyruvate synthase n=1 Tax=Marinicella marina TaxID=2996016 RepID=UPI0022609AF7|nr:phosphoenolpyruvate synthase [Marinicella marina]MCX7554448.1 phosphoenolpyruvate synthase [Marinicella marina]MDJ1140599.1 phosphoenolpyruvate synthase [Marinicella marina]